MSWGSVITCSDCGKVDDNTERWSALSNEAGAITYRCSKCTDAHAARRRQEQRDAKKSEPPGVKGW